MNAQSVGSEKALLSRFQDGDSIEELTRLLHRAYAPHAAAGREFFASYQSSEDTRHRLSAGECWVARVGSTGGLVGTVTIAAPFNGPDGYPRPPEATGSFWQLAVAPSHAGRGLGTTLLRLAEARIVELRQESVVIDTSAAAGELLTWYGRHGYSPIGTWRWSVTNYESIVLAKRLCGSHG
ncbi:GNAT family N-acetyltransferase [Streptomyces exfoliatus]|uniref:GNAT family N-acetyltransferase n=1 Tax=Streptomyces exfoliatus TaxID=1905 RepID=UPI000464EC82|nr:GNAT family N-acetyltransferase [Streptomyces exfoliatus]